MVKEKCSKIVVFYILHQEVGSNEFHDSTIFFSFFNITFAGVCICMMVEMPRNPPTVLGIHTSY